MHVRRFGARGGSPFVFWHALGPDASSEYFGEIGERLGGHGYEVLGVDGPGFGGTPAEEPDAYRLAALAERLHGVVGELGLERPVIAGHSWGGSVAVTYAALHPESTRALVLLDSGHLDYADVEDMDPEKTADDWIAEVRTRPDPRNAEGRGRAMWGMGDRVSTAWPAIAAHRIPTLLLLATEPPHGDTNRAHIGAFAAAMPHAEIRWVEGAGHGIVDTTGPALGDDLAAWLEIA